MWFLVSQGDQILVTGFEPAQPISQYVIIVPPFAEELNKSRKMSADFARAVASDKESKTAVYLIDLFGCGDSGGDLIDASWALWQRNVYDLIQQLALENPQAKCNLIGIRLGASLIIECTRRFLKDTPPHLIFWQPVLNGKLFIGQFLRLKIAAAMAVGLKLSSQEIRDEIAENQGVEVAGYYVSSALISDIEQVVLTSNDTVVYGESISWFEVGTKDDGALLITSTKTVEKWGSSVDIATAYIHDQPFWQTAEITIANKLITEVKQRLMARQC